MASIADATGKFADRIVELLDVFDLSFFVSGAAGLGALVVAAEVYGVSLPFGAQRVFEAKADKIGAELIFVGIVASYAVGLGCFALGRVVRAAAFRSDSPTLIRKAIEHHPVASVLDLASYLDKRAEPSDLAVSDARLRSLYNRLWVHVRTIPELSSTFALVKRYWVLAATFDGMGAALLAWEWPLLASSGTVLTPLTTGVAAVGLLVSAIVCWRQATEYRAYQVDELVATVVHWQALRP